MILMVTEANIWFLWSLWSLRLLIHIILMVTEANV